jgi:hypothetical protein
MLNCFFIVKPAFYITRLESAKQKSAKIEKKIIKNSNKNTQRCTSRKLHSG